MSPTPLHLTVLGPAAALRLATGGSEPLLGPGKPLALLTYLACAPRRTVSREHLVDLLWSDLEPERGRHALRQTLWYLRQQLGSATLSTRGDGLELVAPLEMDRDAFLSAVDGGDLAAAAAAYTGDFLDGFAAPGSVEFEHWADVERQRLRSTFLRVAEALARRGLDEGKVREAAALARRARDADPSSESAWRLLFEALVQCGDRLAVTLEVDQLTSRLAAAGRTPDPATRALLARLHLAGHAPAPAGDAAGLVAELVGREQPFSQVIAAFQAAGPRTQHLHLTAPAGLGKTRLLQDVAVRLRTLGARVVQVRAHPGQRDISYSFAALLAEQLAAQPGAAGVATATAGALVALSPSLSSRFSQPADLATGDEALRRRAAALAELVRVLAEEQRLALLLDDLHWLDHASRQVLISVLAQLEVPGLVIVTAARPVPGGDVGQERTTRLPLPPLSADQVRSLTGSIGLLPPEPWSETLATALARSTGGVPLLVLETLQLAMDRGWLRLDEDAWRCDQPEALAHGLEAGSALRHRVTQLPLEARRVLTLLSVAGAPLAEPLLARAAGAGEHELAACLGILEQRGFAIRVGGSWLPAHDEIAEGTLALAEPDQVRQAHEAVGLALAAEPGAGRPLLAQAGHHLRRAGRPARLGQLFARFLAFSRRLGDRRRVLEIAAEFLGEGSQGEAARRLVGSLPFWTRMHLSSARGPLTAALVLLGVATAGLLALRPPPPPNELVFYQADSLNRLRITEVAPDRARWLAEGKAPLLPERSGRIRFPDALRSQPANYLGDLHKQPGADVWAWNQDIADTADPGTNDVFLAGPTGPARRLTTAPRDDTPRGWSPDGAQLLVSTTRWSQTGWDDYDLAILDTATGVLRRLTFTPDPDYNASWSPDGQQIAFLRNYRDDRPSDAVCFIPPDSVPAPHCITPRNGILLAFHGWWSPDAVVISKDTAGRRVTRLLYPETGHEEPFPAGPVDDYQASQDLSWFAYSVSSPGEPIRQWWIAPHDQPLEARPVRPPDPSRSTIQVGWVGRRVPPYLDRLDFAEFRQPAVLHLSYALRVFGSDQDGGAITPHTPLRWESSDTTIARVDSTGMVTAVGIGTATITAAIPGWRAASLPFTVASSQAQDLLSEDWNGAWTSRWRPTGRPAPQVVDAPDGTPAFLNNGDGSYASGAATRTEWDAHDGLGVEAVVRTPITRVQFQQLLFRLTADLSGGYWTAEDTLLGMPPAGGGMLGPRSCALAYPGQEGGHGRTFMSLDGAGPDKLDVGPWALGGEPYRVRLQIFPDGRCGLAINGVAVWYSSQALHLDRPFRVTLGYSSKETRILVGPLQVWRGVRQDVDWSALDALPDHKRPLAERPRPR